MTKETACRSTAQRKLVYDVIQKSLDHPTAETVYIRARQEAPKISLGTVYRNLNHLSEHGDIRKLSAPVGPDHYDFNMEGHYHFFCSECGEMTDIPKECSPDEKQVLLPSEAGFDIKNYTLIYVGVCPKCNKKGEMRK